MAAATATTAPLETMTQLGLSLRRRDRPELRTGQEAVLFLCWSGSPCVEKGLVLLGLIDKRGRLTPDGERETAQLILDEPEASAEAKRRAREVLR
mgnify:CR=1 FL=1